MGTKKCHLTFYNVYLTFYCIMTVLFTVVVGISEFNHCLIQRETRETRLIPKGSKFSPLQLLLKPKPIILNSNYTKLLDDKVAKILRNLVYGSALVTSHRRRAFNSFPTKIKQISI